MPSPIAMDETHYKILKHLESNPDISQRELAHEMGVSLGKINYCLKALIEKGWLKVNNFKNNQNKLAYAYILTPQGASGKVAMTMKFLQRKMAEYESIKMEISELKRELQLESPIGDQ
ncbi:Transcriptional regulator, MarR family [hydrothermal vent metagenome]|uniref:Transcriptional regulator, MarR family n=1 Tax=hydrothermal vent metagenome TaxID=652676 RepID=A0A3B1C1F0_9ZZZZ